MGGGRGWPGRVKAEGEMPSPSELQGNHPNPSSVTQDERKEKGERKTVSPARCTAVLSHSPLTQAFWEAEKRLDESRGSSVFLFLYK